MTPNSIVCRCVVLVATMACSLPVATVASHVRGGLDVPNCTSQTTLGSGPCLALPGMTCPPTKAVCVGCPLGGRVVLGALCANGVGNPCTGAGCIANQSNSQLSPQNCVNQVCP
jgi:hypothetical protein